ncbi:MAG: peptidase domain-containing ABC transporter [Prevotellaceae bacterium]|jgi:ATP-binding cassette subfamily B protein|nr:peptidase domain-containing ABC transporter [Prevotellaceae bacterium]
MKKRRVRFYHQLTSTDCGAACLAMIASFFGKKYDLAQIKSLFEFTRAGITMQEIADNSVKMGFDAKILKLTTEELMTFPFPVILYWKQEHFLVYERVTDRKNDTVFHLSDPAYGRVKLNRTDFENAWKGNNEKGIAVALQPNENFEKIQLTNKTKKSLFSLPVYTQIKEFFTRNKLRYLAAFLLIIVGLAANWAIPFVFQRIIDEGISSKQINMVLYLLMAQFVLFLSYFISDFFSNVILTKFNFILSVDLKKSLLEKLMKLPVNFFDTRLNTETLQRIGDQNKIQQFVTWKGIEFILNVLNIIIFGSILLYYNHVIFLVYFFLTILSVLWIILFLKRRAVLEYAMFLKQSENSNIIYEFIMNMPEIKINNAQNKTINRITKLQEGLNKLELRSLFLNMYQLIGVHFLSKFKELISIAICAYFIINEDMSLGVLLSVSYVIGQLVVPTNNLIYSVKDVQDTKIANERIGEIHNNKNENAEKKHHMKNVMIENIHINNLSFKYPGKFSPYVLQNVDFSIKKNTVTAIVGASGSGKTTILKLLLAYYNIENGNIYLNNTNINEIFADEWRNSCGIVLQDGKIFSGTIAENIAISDDKIDLDRLIHVCTITNILDFIKHLPMKFDTKIGNAGMQLSGGETQRILISRALYKNPQLIFLDEATSSLDAENEKIIHDNLQEFFVGKTVLIIAHRLSTVKNADQIIVLKNGQICEQGTHAQLVTNKGEYFKLIKNQLELGN